jgi:Metallo-beta-lactamase superfamily
MHIYRIGDVTILNDHIEVPGLGFLPVNAFVLHAEQPVVIDSGLSTADKDFVSALAEVLDPADVRWLWITHPDRDHTGGLWQLLEAAPQARLVTTFLGMGIMSTEWTAPSTESSCSTRASPSMSVTATCTASAHRCSTAPPPPASSTAGPGCCSARTASAPQCRRRSLRHLPTYARWATRFATFSCCGRPSIARGCTRSTRQGSVPR